MPYNIDECYGHWGRVLQKQLPYPAANEQFVSRVGNISSEILSGSHVVLVAVVLIEKDV